MNVIDVTSDYTKGLLVRKSANNNDNYDTFIANLYADLDDCFEHLEENSNHHQGDGEDKISYTVRTFLLGRKYSCCAERNSNGHVDITVQDHKFKWLAEAKLHKGVSWTYKGFNQLTKNYSTGRKNACHGGIIVYNQNTDKNSRQCADEWKEFLKKSEVEVECKNYKHGYLDFTMLEHSRSGEPYFIRTFFVNLKYTLSKDI